MKHHSDIVSFLEHVVIKLMVHLQSYRSQIIVICWWTRCELHKRVLIVNTIKDLIADSKKMKWTTERFITHFQLEIVDQREHACEGNLTTSALAYSPCCRLAEDTDDSGVV